MGEDDDIARSLPQPPPPRPDRRMAAIDAALRRFDGAGDAPRGAGAARPASRPTRWWTSISGPQLGVLVSAALVLAIGVPAALISVGERSVPPVRQTPQPVAEAPHKPIAAAPAALAPVARPSVAAPVPPPVTAPAPVAAPQVALADNAPPPPAAAPPPPPPPAPPAAPAPAMKAEPGAAVLAARAPAAAASSAPMPAPIVARRVADESDIVVTGSKIMRPAGRGDWNACTVNDPARSLARCRKLIDPAATGTAGLAAAHVADGLSRAWEGDADAAIAAFDQAIAIRPKLAIAYLNRGLAYQRQGDLDRAIDDLDRAVRYAPGAARGYYNRSLVLRQRGDLRRADADEARALDLDPRYQAVLE